jgi:hypothetical protein
MNLAEARIVVRPRGRLESMDLAFRYVLGDARPVFGRLALVTLLPAFGVSLLLRAWLDWSWGWVWLIALTLGSIASGAFTVASGELLFERTVTARKILQLFAARFVPYTTALALSRFLTALGSLLLVPGVVAAIRYSYVAETALLEKVPVRRALSRSTVLSGDADVLIGSAGTLALSLAIVLAVETLGISILHELLSIPFEPSRLLSDGGSYFALAGYFLTIPWAATSRFLSYIDERTRQDGWDVQVRFAALEAGDLR